jgi:hypothetical protein
VKVRISFTVEAPADTSVEVLRAAARRAACEVENVVEAEANHARACVASVVRVTFLANTGEGV